MHRRQGWKEATPEGKREVRATLHGRVWRIQSRLKGEDQWTDHAIPTLTDLRSLHAMLERKYRRRRCSLKEVEDVARLIAQHPAKTSA